MIPVRKIPQLLLAVIINGVLMAPFMGWENFGHLPRPIFMGIVFGTLAISWWIAGKVLGPLIATLKDPR